MPSIAPATQTFPPTSAFAGQANATAELYREAESDRLAFWGEQAERLSWDTPFIVDHDGNQLAPGSDHVVPELPKTRSGKIMRRLLRDVAEGHELGDTSTLVDPSVFEAIQAGKAQV